MATDFLRKDIGHTPGSTAEGKFAERELPCNLELERCLLGSILVKQNTCDEIAHLIQPTDFYDEPHRILFEHMFKMHESGRKLDVSLLVEQLTKSGNLEKVGGIAYLARIAEAVPYATHAVDYARHIRDYAMRRCLIDACTETLREAYDSREPSDRMVDRAEQRVFSILEGRSNSSITSLRNLLTTALDRIDALLKGEHTFGGVETGFGHLDHILGGLHPSELIILAARPSMGKTALAMNIAEHVAISLQEPVLFVSLEMSSNELIDRMLCSCAQVNTHKVRTGIIRKEDRARLVDRAGEISEAPLFVDDSPSRTVSQIAAAARRIKRQNTQLSLIVIDYLQLIEPDNPDDPRQEQVAKIARRLKGLSRELNVPVLCLAQLNRQAEVAKENRPRLSHLRESGAIEQDADVVMFVHREEYYRTGDAQQEVAGQAEIIVAKQRNGPIDNVELLWQKEYTRFVNPATRSYSDFEQYQVADDEF